MKVGLALSGGGARGIAHLGVLKALQEREIKISAISGTSAGSIIGAFFCAGYAPEEILKIITKTSFIRYLRPAISFTGLIKIEKLIPLLQKYLPEDSFDALEIPLSIATTNINKGEIEYFEHGPLIRPILASCCIPALFDPISINGSHFVDGGILNNLPVQPLEAKSDRIIGSHCNPISKGFELTNIKALVERSLLIAVSQNTLESKKKCDLIIEPPELGWFLGSDLAKSEEMFTIGYEHTLTLIEKLNYFKQF